MKKIALSVAAFVAAAPLVLVSGAAFATPTYTPSLVKQFDTNSDTNFAPESIVPFNDTQAVVELANGDLWLTDGTTAGTVDITTDAEDAGLDGWDFMNSQWERKSIADGQGNLYFAGMIDADGDQVWNMWKFDGTDFTQVSTDNFDYIAEVYFLDGNIYLWGQNFDYTFDDDTLYQVAIPSGNVFEIDGGNDCDGAQREARSVLMVEGYLIYANDSSNNCDYNLMSWDSVNPLTPPVDLSEAIGASGTDTDFAGWDDRIVWNGKVYFSGRNESEDDWELWTTDGTLEGTSMLKDINTENFGSSSNPGSDSYMWFTEYNDELYFAANDGLAYVVYKTDGTESGTVPAVTQVTQPNNYSEGPGVLVDGKMIVNFYDSATGQEIYITDGTDAGTTLLKDIRPGSADSLCQNSYCPVPTVFDNLAFFPAYDGETSAGWVTDGTEEGTVKVTDFGGEWAVGDLNEFTFVQVGSHLLFGVKDTLNDGGTGEMALYSFGSQESALAKTGADVDALAFAGLFALVAGAGVYAVRRRVRV